MTYFHAACDGGGILVTSSLLDKIGEYVKANPGCITGQYDPKDVSQRNSQHSKLTVKILGLGMKKLAC